MPSSFAWLDYSDRERRKMLDVIDLFGERTTRDELGLGGVRDSFADRFFPGTSTIQTRARYFLFIPWIYQKLEDKKTPPSEIEVRARKAEVALIHALCASNDTQGVIGKESRERLQRLPSAVYWQGLKNWGICLFDGSREEYHRSLGRVYERRHGLQGSHKDFEGESGPELGVRTWHACLPLPPDSFPAGAEFVLTGHEADYLRERIVTRRPDSLLAVLLRDRLSPESAPFAWDLPHRLPPPLREQLNHARCFSEVMHGAQLLYNLMLAETTGRQDGIDLYDQALTTWWQLVTDRRAEIRAWDRARFWEIVREGNPRVSPRAVRFIDSWTDLVQRASNREAVVNQPGPRRLVENREAELKGRLARLGNVRAQELWAGWSGAGQIDMRWSKARAIVRDILTGLEGPTHA